MVYIFLCSLFLFFLLYVSYIYHTVVFNSLYLFMLSFLCLLVVCFLPMNRDMHRHCFSNFNPFPILILILMKMH
jgi:hypothetical protein